MGSNDGKECATMGEFIAKYWIEVVFSLVCAGVAWVVKFLLKSINIEREAHDKKLIETMKQGLEAGNNQMKEDMAACSTKMMQMLSEQTEALRKSDEIIHEEIDGLRDGMLSMQGRNFKNDCHKLLSEDHIVTAIEYESILADHIVYNKLGGNHEGDALFSMVESKYKNTIGK